MSDPMPRGIDWGSAEVKGGTLAVQLTGSSSASWRNGCQRALVLLGSPHGRWGEVTVKKKSIRVNDVELGAEAELRHFLESVVVEANAALPQPARDGDGETPIDPQIEVDREMTATFRTFAGG